MIKYGYTYSPIFLINYVDFLTSLFCRLNSCKKLSSYNYLMYKDITLLKMIYSQTNTFKNHLQSQNIMLVFLASMLIISFIFPAYASEINNQYFSNPDYEVYSLPYKQFEYYIPYKITGANIKSIILDCDSHNLLIHLQQSSNGSLEINIPKKMLETEIDNADSFLVFINDFEGDFKEIYSDEDSKTLKINFSDDTETIEIIISNVSQFPKPVICGTGGVDDSPYYKLLPPLRQYESGISLDNIKCNDNLQLILKYDGSPACVKSETISKLIERGWAKLDT